MFFFARNLCITPTVVRLKISKIMRVECACIHIKSDGMFS